MSVFSGPEVSNPSGLILYLDTANSRSYPGTGTSWFDLSGLGNHATITGSPSYQRGYFTFDGTTQYATCGNNVNNTDGTSSITMCAWVQPDATWPSYSVIIDKSPAGGASPTYRLQRYFNTSQLEFYDNSPFSSSTSNVPVGSWCYLCASVSGTSGRFYINGADAGPITATSSFNNGSNTTYIGRYGGSGSQYKGNISTVQIFQRSLSAAEIGQNFEAARGRYGI